MDEVTSHRVAEQEDNDPPLDSTPTRARHAQVDVTSAGRAGRVYTP